MGAKKRTRRTAGRPSNSLFRQGFAVSDGVYHELLHEKQWCRGVMPIYSFSDASAEALNLYRKKVYNDSMSRVDGMALHTRTLRAAGKYHTRRSLLFYPIFCQTPLTSASKYYYMVCTNRQRKAMVRCVRVEVFVTAPTSTFLARKPAAVALLAALQGVPLRL